MSKEVSWMREITLEDYKQADRHHGKTGLRDMRQSDVATQAQ